MSDDANLQRLAGRVGRRLLERRMTIGTAESCTGGFIAKVLTDIAGSSAWFSEGVVTYSNDAKMRLLGVTAAALARHGAVSKQVAQQMVLGMLRRSQPGIALSVTGIAGPGGATPGKPVGTVWLAWAMRDGRRVQTIVLARRFRGDRDAVRRKTVRCALLKVLQLIQ